MRLSVDWPTVWIWLGIVIFLIVFWGPIVYWGSAIFHYSGAWP